MATEADLKKVELKVSVICCDGCKRKVKKALYSIEGVLKIEIDPLQPKVSILGSIDPQILIKKLHKAGKQAQLWSQDNNQINSSPKEKKKVNDQIPLVQPLMSISKPSSSSIVKPEEISSDKSKHCHNNGGEDHQQMNKLATLKNHQLHLCYCMVEPCYAVAVPTLMAAPPGHRSPPSCCPDHHHPPPARVPVSSEATSQIGDFFSEENTIGCYLM